MSLPYGLRPFHPEPSGVQDVVAVLVFQCSRVAVHWQPFANRVTSTSYADAPGTASQATIGVDVSYADSVGNGLSSMRRSSTLGSTLSKLLKNSGPTFQIPAFLLGSTALTRQ